MQTSVHSISPKIFLLTLLGIVSLFAQEMKIIKIINDKIAADKGMIGGVIENTEYEIRRAGSNGVELIGYAKVLVVKDNICALKVTKVERYQSVKVGDIGPTGAENI